MKFFLFFLLFLIIFLPWTSAVGIAGDLMVDIDFKPNLVHQQEYSVSNGEKPLIVVVSGPLKDFVEVKPREIVGGGRIKVTMRLPERLDGGIYQTKICAQSLPEGTGTFQSISSACGLINIRSLYDGKYLQTWTFSAKGVDLVDENIPFLVTLDNWGKEDIISAHALIKVYDLNNILVGTTETETKRVPSAQVTTLNAYLKNTFEPGSYWAEAELSWDEGTEKKNTTFNVGSALIKVTNITQEFYINETNLINVWIKNGFKGVTKNVYFTLEVGEKLIKSPTLDLDPFKLQKVELALDTQGFEPRDYRVRVIIYQNDVNVNQQDFTFTVKEREKKTNNVGLVVGLAIVLAVILGNIIFVIVMAKKRKQRSKPINPTN